jgi:hypothetical protein
VELDGRTDLYSFGIIAYEMITGRVPFQADTNYAIIHSQIFDDPPPPSRINPQISGAMEAVLLRMLAKEPAKRFPDATRFAAAFKQAALELPSAVTPASAEKPALPDPTAGVTDVAAPPVLPDLSNAPETTVTSIPSAVKGNRSWRPILGGVLGGMLLCLLFLFIAARIVETNQMAGTTTAVAQNPPTTDTLPTATALPTIPPVTPTAVPQEQDTSPLLPGRLPELKLDDPRSSETLLELLAEDPDSLVLRAELALSYMRDGDYQAAREQVRAVLGMSRNPTVLIIMTNRLLELREYDLATFVLEEGLTKFDQDQQLQQLLMMTYTLNQQSPDRVREYIALLKEGDAHSPDTIAIGDAYIAFQSGNIGESIRILTTHLEQNRLDFKTELQFVLGLAHKEVGETDAARALLEAARSDRTAPSWLNQLILEQLVDL